MSKGTTRGSTNDKFTCWIILLTDPENGLNYWSSLERKSDDTRNALIVKNNDIETKKVLNSV